jgi:DNA-binding transcriptional LysR family regulator
LVILDVEGFPIRRHWYLAYAKDKQLSVVAQAFLEFLHEESKLLSEKYLLGITGFPKPGLRNEN